MTYIGCRQVRNAIQALQMLACSPQSNPNLPTPAASRGSGVLARSSSHPPDAICWNPPERLIDASTQTDWPVDLFEAWVRANPRRSLKALGLDPNVILRLPPPSPTPSPSSPPPPPYEPLSPLASSPQQSPSRSLTTGNNTTIIQEEDSDVNITDDIRRRNELERFIELCCGSKGFFLQFESKFLFL